MKSLFKILVLVVLVYAGWWIWKNYDLPAWYAHVKDAIDRRDTRSVFVLPQKRGEAFANPNTIYIKDNCEFSPKTLEIIRGEKITWQNISQTEQYLVGAGFDIKIIPAGRTFVKAFSQSGGFDFNCSDNEQFKGLIIMK